jgi:hypothetical protein
MIIDTKKLLNKIDEYESEKDYAHMSFDKLNVEEKRALKTREIIREVEKLAEQFLPEQETNNEWYDVSVKPVKGKRILVFFPRYTDQCFRFRIMDSESIKMCTEVKAWKYLNDPEM